MEKWETADLIEIKNDWKKLAQEQAKKIEQNECYVIVKSERIKAEFIGVFQYSNVINPSPMVGGHQGGVIAYPIAVVKAKDQLLEVKLSDVIFKSVV